MRTTVNLDDDVLELLKARAQRQGKTLGEVIGEMTREMVVRERAVPYDADPDGFPIVQRKRPGHVLTVEEVSRILDEAGS